MEKTDKDNLSVWAISIGFVALILAIGAIVTDDVGSYDDSVTQGRLVVLETEDGKINSGQLVSMENRLKAYADNLIDGLNLDTNDFVMKSNFLNVIKGEIDDKNDNIKDDINDNEDDIDDLQDDFNSLENKFDKLRRDIRNCASLDTHNEEERWNCLQNI